MEKHETSFKGRLIFQYIQEIAEYFSKEIYVRKINIELSN